jgi:hypothetical protein
LHVVAYLPLVGASGCLNNCQGTPRVCTVIHNFRSYPSGGRIVVNLPFLTDEQDTLSTDDISLYPRLGTACALLDKLVSSRFPNALSPIVSAHSQAAIPLHLGAKVLQQLSKALMRGD